MDPFDGLDELGEQIEANRGVVPFPGVRAAAPTKPKVTLWLDDADWIEAQIRPRPWVVPGYLMRGAVTVLGGPGSAGKSSLTTAWSVSLALGIPLGGFVPSEPATVLTYNVEDDQDEQRRRLSAALRRVDRHTSALRGRVLRCGPQGVGTLLERDLNGQLTMTGAWERLVQIIEDRRPDVLVLDPLVELHTAEENDNTALRQVIAHIRALAQQHHLAVVLVHHTRKGAVAGDVDSIRGAGSLIGAARAAFTVAPMSKEEAEELGIPEDGRRSYVRVDSVKGNYAPARAAAWHELVEYTLDNEEQVAAIVPWDCPQAAEGPSLEVMALIEAAVERGTPQGPYSPRLALDQDRSLAPLLAQHGITTTPAQKGVLKRLQQRGFTVERFIGLQRKAVTGLRAPNGAPDARWLSTSAQEGADA